MWLEYKYINLLSSRLSKFKRTSNQTYNFRCPICGDSSTKRDKARGYMYLKKNKYMYHCHNCGVSMRFESFIKHVDETLFDEYIKESLVDKYINRKDMIKDFSQEEPVFIDKSHLKKLKSISQLRHDHPAVLYVKTRKIPNSYHSKLFYAPKFKTFVNTIIPNKFETLNKDEPRLIIPFFDEKKKLFGFQGRSFSNEGIRYITIMIDRNRTKVFNLDSCDREKPHYVLEGPIDSMFVKNSIAMAGNTIDHEYINNHSIFVFDNEPRNVDICKKIENVIDKGHSVVLFPEHIAEKDINDMVLNGIDIHNVLSQNISKGLEAKLIFTAWKKI